MIPILFAALVLLLSPAPARGAEFDIDSGRVILRQLQYCTDCGSALLVTHVQPGALVRCPDCGHEQHRLQNNYVLSQLYQICKTCHSPLDPAGHRPGEAVECDTCHTKQRLSSDAFSLAGIPNGPGYAPGFPPGTNKKRLLLSPQKPDAPVAVHPVADRIADIPEIRELALNQIAKPPQTHTPILEEVRLKEYPPLPDPPTMARPQQRPPPQPPQSRQSRQAPPAPPAVEAANVAAAKPPERQAGALDVPAVTADLFGGKRTESGARKAAFIPPGKVLARVDGAPIHARDVDRVVNPVVERLKQQATPQDAAQIAEREKALREEVLQRLIDRELAVREAAAIGYQPDPNAVRDRENELMQILAGSGVDTRREATRDVIMMAMRKRFGEKPGAASPEAVREFYRQNRDKMLQPRLIALDQLVVYEERGGQMNADGRDYRDVALEISEGLEGGMRFDELRERYDEFTRRAGIPHVEPVLQPEAAFAKQVLASAGDLRRGAVFGPLFLSGMALFGKVTDLRPAGPIPFEEVKADIRRRLEEEATEKNLDAWLKRLRHKARVELF